MDSSDLSDGPITLQEYLEVKKALASSEAEVQQLMTFNNNLSDELRRLETEVGRMGGGRGVISSEGHLMHNLNHRMSSTEQKRKKNMGVERNRVHEREMG